jgi:hypothetical protein
MFANHRYLASSVVPLRKLQGKRLTRRGLGVVDSNLRDLYPGYTNVTLTDTTNNVSIFLGDFSSGCLLPNVRGAC